MPLLGDSGLEVSSLALGSWRTFERISRDAGVAVMRAARACGISFLDDARYNDEAGTAPIPSGYSEVVFGELFRASGWHRDEVVVANKLWWEFWPEESVAQELDGSLGRMGFDHLDLVYAAEPPEGLAVTELVAALAELVASGKVHAWGVLNWPYPLLREAVDVARREGLPAPCAAQVPYNVALREWVESAEAIQTLDATGVAAVASTPLVGGVLSGKYADGARAGRMADRLDVEHVRPAVTAADRLREVADSLDTTPAALAIAFALANPRVASVLFGATRPEQVHENAAAVALLERVGAERIRSKVPFT